MMRRCLLVFFVIFLKQCNAVCYNGKCIQKCCPHNQYVLERIISCLPYNKELNILDLPVHDESLMEIGHARDFFTVKPGTFLDTKLKNDFIEVNMAMFLMPNGTLRLECEKDNHFLRKNNEYCLDYNLSNTTGELNHTNRIVAWVTFSNMNSPYKQVPFIFKCGLLVSCFFFILVLVVYSLLPELRKLSGLILMAYVLSMLMSFIFLFAMHVGVQSFNDSTCLPITLIIYYFLQSSFAWCNVMSYDVFWTFRGYAKSRTINRRGEHFKFYMYCIYGWGMPLVLATGVGILNDSSLAAPKSKTFIRPRIPRLGCFLDSDAKLPYLYGPMSIMIVVNWVLFAMTAFNIWRRSRGTEMLNSADSTVTGSAAGQRSNKRRLMVYLKLSVLMGLSWILEVVSSLHKGYEEVWYLSDAYNIFIGLIIFILFVCNKKIYNKLKSRFKGQEVAMSSKRSRSTTESAPLQTPLCTPDTTVSFFRQPQLEKY